MIAPRLLSPGQARKYVGGNEPSDYAEPFGTAKGLFYDREAIDAKLDALSGLTRSSRRDDPEGALQEWLAGERGHGAA